MLRADEMNRDRSSLSAASAIPVHFCSICRAWKLEIVGKERLRIITRTATAKSRNCWTKRREAGAQALVTTEKDAQNMADVECRGDADLRRGDRSGISAESRLFSNPFANVCRPSRHPNEDNDSRNKLGWRRDHGLTRRARRPSRSFQMRRFRLSPGRMWRRFIAISRFAMN